MVRLVIFILFFYLIYFFLKYLIIKPFRDGYASRNKHSEKARNPWKRYKEGDVSISYNPKEGANADNKVGEYVDYEEVKD